MATINLFSNPISDRSFYLDGITIFWGILWVLIWAFILSAIIQAVVSKARTERPCQMIRLVRSRKPVDWMLLCHFASMRRFQ
jgi:hypothetical protein